MHGVDVIEWKESGIMKGYDEMRMRVRGKEKNLANLFLGSVLDCLRVPLIDG